MESHSMKRAFANNFLPVMLASALVACAGRPPETTLDEKLAQRGYTLGEQVRSVINFQVSGWNSVDHKHVIMNFGASRYYLLTLRTSCDGLLSATLINFSTTAGSLTDTDKLLVRNDSHHLSQCYIKTIHELKKTRDTR